MLSLLNYYEHFFLDMTLIIETGKKLKIHDGLEN